MPRLNPYLDEDYDPLDDVDEGVDSPDIVDELSADEKAEAIDDFMGDLVDMPEEADIDVETILEEEEPDIETIEVAMEELETEIGDAELMDNDQDVDIPITESAPQNADLPQDPMIESPLGLPSQDISTSFDKSDRVAQSDIRREYPHVMTRRGALREGPGIG